MTREAWGKSETHRASAGELAGFQTPCSSAAYQSVARPSRLSECLRTVAPRWVPVMADDTERQAEKAEAPEGS